jgi:hypothetical protein
MASDAADMEKSLGAAAALRRRVAQARGNEALVLQAVERGVECPGRRLAAGPFADFLADGDAVCVVAETQNRQQHHLFEFA